MSLIQTNNKYIFAIIVMFIIPISGLSIDIYVPSLPAVSQYFHTSQTLAQMTITFYMIGLGIMQLIAGGISDSYGRKKPFLISMLIYIIASFAITYSRNIAILLTLRLIQGMMVGVLVVPIRSIIPDLFKDKELFKMSSFMTIAWSIGPIIAPAIGGYLQYYFGWKANFYFLTGYSVIGFLLVMLFVPETSKYHHPFYPKQILNRYKVILTNLSFASGVMINALLYSLIILFSVVAPFLIQDILHYSAIQFGHVALLIGIVWMLGSITNQMTLRMEINKKIYLCLGLMFFISLIAILTTLLFKMNIYTILIPILAMIWLGGIIFPNNFANIMALYPNSTASVNGLFGSLLFLFTAMCTFIGSSLQSTTFLPLAISYSIIIMTAIIIMLVRDNVKAHDKINAGVVCHA